MANEISAKHVTKFDGTNFLEWKFQINALLVAHGIDIVNGTRVKPENNQFPEGKTWIRDNAKAMFLLSSAMEYTQLENLLIYTTAKEMWDNLIVIHERKSASNKLLLTQRFHAYHMETMDTVTQHIARIQNMARQLMNLGENVSNVTVMAKILASLTPKYENFQTAGKC